MSPDVRTCFVISPIGEDGSEIRKRADQVLRHVITPAVSECGFEPIRADQIAETGLITTQVIQHIVDDPLVIADLTGSNPNVFYELAIRHAIRRPLIQISQKDEKIPFDVAGMRTIYVDYRDLDSVEEAKKEIIRQVNASIDKGPKEIESPISVSVELQTLKRSEKPEERSFAEYIYAIEELRSGVSSIEKRLSNPENIIPPSYLSKVFEGTVDRSSRVPERYRMETRELQAMVMDLYEQYSRKYKKEDPELLDGFKRLIYMLDRIMH
jgi:hypothetical protein